MEANPTPKSLNWFEIWRMAFLRPTIQTFSRIINDSKASIRWGMLWSAITALIIWAVGPQRSIWWGFVATHFGIDAASYFLIIGTIAFPVFGAITLLLNVAIAHALSRLFGGAGTFHQLVFSWGAIQLPFILFSGLAFNILPYIYSMFRLLSSTEMNLPALGIILLVSTLIAGAGILYLFYAQGVAFSAVEKFSVGKGFGILFLFACILGIASACLSFSFQAIVSKFLL